MTYDELMLENIIFDQVMTEPISRAKRSDTSSTGQWNGGGGG